MIHKAINSKYFKVLLTMSLLLTLANFILLPLAIRHQAKNVIKDNGLRSVGLSSLYCNVFAGNCEVGPIAVFKSPENKFLIRKLFLEIDILKLFSQKINISEAKINGIYAKINKSDSGEISIAGISLKDFEENKTGNNKEVNTEGKKSDWQFGVKSFDLGNSIILYSEDTTKSKIFTNIHKIGLNNFAPWKKGLPTNVNTDLTINDIGFVSKIKATLNESQKNIDGIITVTNVTKSKVKRLIGHNDVFKSFGDKGKISASKITQEFSLQITELDSAQTIKANTQNQIEGLELNMLSPTKEGYLNIKSDRLALKLDDFQYNYSNDVDNFLFEKIEISEPTKIAVIDNVKDKKVLLNLEIKELSFGKADSSKGDVKTPVKLVGTLNKTSGIIVEGWAKPFADKVSLQAGFEANNFDLSSYSPYLENFAGTKLKKGKATIISKASINSGNIDSQINVKVQSLSFKASRDSETISKQLGIPLETAVGLLQDSDGNIDLTIPVKGSSDSPDFDIGQVVSTAVKGAIMSTVSLALDILFPPGMLISNALSENKYPSLKPLEFNEGKTKISTSSKQQLDNIINLLSKRPKLSISLCPISTSKDLNYLIEKKDLEIEGIYPFFTEDENDNQKLKEKGNYIWSKSYNELEGISKTLEQAIENLNKERVKKITSYIVSKNSKLDNRISKCLPEFNLKDSNSPHVEISW